MSASIFGSRFIAQRNRSVWHGLGERFDDEQMSAFEGLQRVGDYNVTLEPVYTEIALPGGYGGKRIELPERVILRHPTHDNPEYRTFGVVGPDYGLITASDAARIWDEHVGVGIETLGVLYEGKCLFISTQLPSYEVRGEQVDDFLVLANYMDGLTASVAMQTRVCPVCHNTLTGGIAAASELHRIVHDRTARSRMAEWLTGIYQRAVSKQAAIKEAETVLAEARCTKGAAASVLEAAYPYPNDPKHDAPDEVIKRRAEEVAKLRQTVELRRTSALGLFLGDGTGMDLVSRKGTMWGLVQAVCETEDYRRGGSATQAAASAVLGPRAATKERAFTAALDWVRAN